MHDDAAALHLFRVSAGLDSLVPGESEILGQVRAAFDAAAPGPLLDRVFRQALQLGKRVRSETAIGESPASVPAAAAALAAQVFGDLRGRKVLLVGAGPDRRARRREPLRARSGDLLCRQPDGRGGRRARRPLRRCRAHARRGRGQALRGRRRPHLDGRPGLLIEAKDIPVAPAPSALLHRHRRPARRRPRRARALRLLPLRHRRSRGGGERDARRPPGRGRARRAARRSRRPSASASGAPRSRSCPRSPRCARTPRRSAPRELAKLSVAPAGGAAADRGRDRADPEQAPARADRADEGSRRRGWRVKELVDAGCYQTAN